MRETDLFKGSLQTDIEANVNKARIADPCALRSEWPGSALLAVLLH
jgi:hypothetical protein